MMWSQAGLILVPSNVPTEYLTKHGICFLDVVFNNKSENYPIYEVGLNQPQFSISVQGIMDNSTE